MNKVRIVLLLLVISTLFYIGALIYYEMAVEIENNPEIKEIGGPPVFTDLRLVAVVVVFAVMMCSILLYVNKNGEEDKVKSDEGDIKYKEVK